MEVEVEGRVGGKLEVKGRGEEEGERGERGRGGGGGREKSVS